MGPTAEQRDDLSKVNSTAIVTQASLNRYPQRLNNANIRLSMLHGSQKSAERQKMQEVCLTFASTTLLTAVIIHELLRLKS